ncbi:MAG: penicillin-binding transpeptidase domain-containing protein [Lachnospiraceae bacterium]
MAKRKNRDKRNKIRKYLWGIVSLIIILLSITLYSLFFIREEESWTKPEELLITYMNYISEQNYKEMYKMIDIEASGKIDKEDFIKRNSAIYQGIEVQNMKIRITSYNEQKNIVQYQTSFDTLAGNISFQNEAFFLKGEKGYKLVWDDSLIYPNLHSMDKIKVATIPAKRGEILDRNGHLLAGEGVASSVGIVPGRIKKWDSAIKQIGNLLDMKPEEIEKKLSAKWVKEDSFVPMKTLPKIEEIELTSLEQKEEILREYERQQQLSEIAGVMISDTKVRFYPLGDVAAHLVGYVQSVTAEDLEKHIGEGYTANSVIGRNGIEGRFESELKGKNGCRIYIVDSSGNEIEELAYKMVEHGKNVKLTIDSELQKALYKQFQEDKSCSVAMNPYTGEVLALVSTPSYDNNDFVLGLSSEKWIAIKEDEDKPMYNRFKQTWCPGSTFKPIIAAIGLELGVINPEEDYENDGLSWQKDTSWGSYHVTTLHVYEPVVLENALMCSDNIYFAKAALKIGTEKMKESLLKLGFQKEIPFEILMSKSQYSNTENIETEIQLADSGYGQGQILLNPMHMACIYTAFCNQGNIIKPYLVCGPETTSEYWISNAFSNNTINFVLEGMKKIINDPHGTGYKAHREDVLLAGKTGTAEIKVSKDDTSGTELGWFAIFTVENTIERPILIVNMVEDVKERGGSGYVVEKDKQVLEGWFNK